ncbi:SDR family NAD(P)-dependent oxidoreductase [Actinoalloteichus hymeniacidonis]|uniref:Short-chain alcohol dehydrogenase n=1 Tax=Actinoalloteichus hymeniacidonis TaxID=340345 RepID=A0AAC9MXY0_9PSEU|nr:SDR family NAD(P)-dependent oxidoreductase [Actinoalloteichus hymeniacidonis]AOS63808.1 short-chain alcohol dehydrogenase [Actinoalloteichus hymeniacidonis]MBB5908138.1 NAD(P)-dependent dehydrogenase (short-subunit alcohol dehydrogenase family) [Actinoalloteichus hymeniacidonis]
MSSATAVVTGAASGIGRALAETLAARGADLVLADVNAPALQEVADRLGARAVPTDVAVPAAVEELAEAAGDAELICLNAGIVGAYVGAPWEVSPADWDRVFAVNVGGVVNGLRAFVPRLLAAARPAHLLITGSLAGAATFPGGGAYGPSKHAVLAVAEHTALALADTPIGVSVICPALVSTGMSDAGVAASEVARQALTTIEDGTFAVLPAEWRQSVVAGATRLAAGQRPVAPTPTESSTD